MSGKVYKAFKVAIYASVFLILLGCCTYHSDVVAEGPTKRAGWLVYWDIDAGEKDLKNIANKLDKVSFFGAYFDKNDKIFIPQELIDERNQFKKKKDKYETYLTIVNDKQNSDGSSTIKDIEVLRRLFSDDALMEKHIDEVIALTLQGAYDGIELDYENIWKDEILRQSFLRFASKLYVKALKNDLKLRIVLEPSTPFSSGEFFKGPEYVVMLYNLYGLHSDPGPKANKKFIEKIIARMEGLPGEKSVAFATGGCVWGDNGEKRLLTEAEAKNLAVKYHADMQRDEESQCVIFDYKENGVSYQVWYADIKTLNDWIKIAKEQGVNNISLWRFGGNMNLNKVL